MVRNPLYAFFLKAALWLPVCLGLWYWKAEWFNSPAAIVSGWIMEALFPRWVEAVEWSQRIVSLVTNLEVPMVAGMKEGQHAALVVEANPLSYTFGLPFFAALLLASGEARRWRKLLMGAVILIPFQAWGICFDLLTQVAITAGPVVAAQTGFSPWQREEIALGYQFGHLILPTVAPIALWLALNRQFISMLMLEGALQREEHPGRPG
jgi:hypothetical protein